MNYSSYLIDLFKEKNSLKNDSEAAELIGLRKQNVSEIRKGDRHLTEEQAVWVAQQCALDCALVLVELAAERSKSDTAKTVWAQLAKKLRAAASTAIVAAFLMVSAVPAPNPPQRIRNIP